MAKDLVNVLRQLKERTEKVFPPGKKREKYVAVFAGLLERYNGLEVPEYLEETYQSLIKRGSELQKENKLKDEKMLQYYQRYCTAALYDFKDNIRPLNWIVKLYVVTAILFMVLTPQYYPWILPIIMIVPIFMGLRGMKKRTLTGLYYGNSVVPLGLMVSVTHLNNTYLAMKNYDQYLAQLATQYHMSISMAGSMLTVFNVMSVVLLGTSIGCAVFSYKYRDMFV